MADDILKQMLCSQSLLDKIGSGGKGGYCLGVLQDVNAGTGLDLKQANMIGGIVNGNILNFGGKGKKGLFDKMCGVLGKFDVSCTSVQDFQNANIGDLTPCSAPAIFGSASAGAGFEHA